MARLLRDLDYDRLIQSDNLLQIIESNEQIKLDIEQAAQAEMISYLKQRYQTDSIFANTADFDITLTYKAKNVVQFSADTYSASATYVVGNRMVFTDSNIYQCVSNTTAGQNPTTHSAKWALLCEDNLLFYVTLPYPEYDRATDYVQGDKIWFNNKIYTANVAMRNVPPVTEGFWTAGATYTVLGKVPYDGYSSKITYSTGDRVTYLGITYNALQTALNQTPAVGAYWELSEDVPYFTQGDARNQQIVLYLLDITLYHLHSRINPRNIPDLRKERYDGNSPNQTGGAIGWLKKVASGDINADLPEISPEQGVSIRWGNADGSTTRASNLY